jgi:cation diffusion facilitator family transporter
VSEQRRHRGHHRTALVSVAAAVLLVALKLGTGIATGSLSLISAGIESSGDVIAALLTLLAVRLAVRPADADHPFGHRRAENLAALGEAAILTGGAVFIVIEAVGQLAGGGEHLQARWYIFAVIGVAMVIDLSRVVVSLRTARKYRSAALRSNAMHFAADFTGSLSVLGGMVLVAAGVQAGDAIAALVVAGVIFTAAGRLIYDNARVLMDTMPEDVHRRAVAAVDQAAPHADVQRVRVRESGGRHFADVVVGVPGGQAVAESHATADAIEDALHRALPGSDVVVHLEPGGRDLSLRDRVLAVALAHPEVREVHDVNVLAQDDGAIVALHVKFDRDVALTDAHHVADAIEDELRALPGVLDARTHLEPLEPEQRPAAAIDTPDALSDQIVALAERSTGHRPIDVRVLHARSGLVVLLTVAVDSRLSLRDAHATAGLLEQSIRRDHPGIAEVVVHTEPAPTLAAR